MYFLERFLEKSLLSNVIKIRLVGAELFQGDRQGTDGRGDMTKPLVGFRTFANASKNAILTRPAINGYIAVSILLYVHGCNRKF